MQEFPEMFVGCDGAGLTFVVREPVAEVVFTPGSPGSLQLWPGPHPGTPGLVLAHVTAFRGSFFPYRLFVAGDPLVRVVLSPLASRPCRGSTRRRAIPGPGAVSACNRAYAR